jgi:hypothetical protein
VAHAVFEAGPGPVEWSRHDDGGAHAPKELVVQWWVDRAAGAGWRVISTEITSDGHISVGVDGDLAAATAALDREFPGWTTVHSQAEIQPV